MQPTIIGLDLAKSVFQVHGVDAEGQIAVRRKLRRREVRPFFETRAPCLVGMEACATARIGRASFRSWAMMADDAAQLCEALPPPAEE